LQIIFAKYFILIPSLNFTLTYLLKLSKLIISAIVIVIKIILLFQSSLDVKTICTFFTKLLVQLKIKT